MRMWRGSKTVVRLPGRQRRLRIGHRGSILIALLVVSTLGVLGTPFITISLGESRLQWMANDRTQALAVAEAGVEQAIWEYNYNDNTFILNTACTNSQTPYSCCTGAQTGCWYNAAADSECTGSCRQRSYQLLAADGTTLLGTTTVFVKDIYNDTPAVRSDGQAQGSSVKTRVRVSLQRHRLSPFQQAAFATTSTDIGLNLDQSAFIDGYDSRIGAYGGGNVSADGDIQTNSTKSGTYPAVIVHTGATIQGGAHWAPGGAIDSFGGIITGPQTSRPPQSFATPTPPADPAGSCEELGSVFVDVGPPTIKTGTSYCATAIDINNGGVLDFPNLQMLYVRGELRINIGTLKVGQGTVRSLDLHLLTNAVLQGYKPGRVDIYTAYPFTVEDHSTVTGFMDQPKNVRVYAWNGGAFTLNTHSHINGMVYANGDVVNVSDDSGIYGALIGTTISMSGGGGDPPPVLHFDKALKDVSNSSLPGWLTGANPPASVTVTSWTREGGN